MEIQPVLRVDMSLDELATQLRNNDAMSRFEQAKQADMIVYVGKTQPDRAPDVTLFANEGILTEIFPRMEIVKHE